MGAALRLDVLPHLDDPVLVLAFDGWNDAGDAASHAADFLADALKAPALGEIDPEEYYDFTVRRPDVEMDATGARQVRWPAYRFRYGVVPGRCALVTGHGGEPHLRWRAFCDDVVELAARTGARRVVLLGAFLADVLYSRPVRVTGFASDPERVEELGVLPTGYEGPTGIVGVLGSRLADEGLEVASFWAGLPHYITASPNPRGALALLQVTTSYLDLPVDLAPVRAAAAEFEEHVSKLVAADPALAEYVRDLKKREFVQ